jgi:DUF4097 and DUF4098 domain-containing protein YvlB
MPQLPYRPSEGHPMRRLAVFAAVLAIIVCIGSQPWSGGLRGFVNGFHAHARPTDGGSYGDSRAGADGWAIHDCHGQDSEHTKWGWGNNERACELRTITLPSTGRLDVSSMNGGIHIVGEDRHDVQVEARIEAWAGSESEAEGILHQIQIETAGGTIHDKGPNFHWGHLGYGINYTIHAPRQLSAELKTMNGGIGLAHLDGDLKFDTTNGGVDLTDLAGNVHGSTVNGGLDICLSGDRWRGKGLDAETTNGGVNLNIPEHYSAHLETGTVNGGIELNFPVTIQGEIKHHLATDIGGGGPTIHAETVNGGITLNHGSASADKKGGDEDEGTGE